MRGLTTNLEQTATLTINAFISSLQDEPQTVSCRASLCVQITTRTEVSCSFDIPLYLLDADLVIGLLIVIKPLAFLQLDALELGAGINAFGQPLALGMT